MVFISDNIKIPNYTCSNIQLSYSHILMFTIFPFRSAFHHHVQYTHACANDHFCFFSTLLGAKVFGKQLRSNDVVFFYSVFISVLGVFFPSCFMLCRYCNHEMKNWEEMNHMQLFMICVVTVVNYYWLQCCNNTVHVDNIIWNYSVSLSRSLSLFFCLSHTESLSVLVSHIHLLGSANGK